MGKTYFNLADQLNFNGSGIKIKGNAVKPLEKPMVSGRATFGTESSRIYQSVIASQPLTSGGKPVGEIPAEVYLRVINSSPRAGRISIEKDQKAGYVVKTSISLNQVSMRNASAASRKVENTEKIVVSGLQVDGTFKYQFIEAALHDIDVLVEQGTSPSDITWIVFWHNSVYQDFDLKHFQETASQLGIKLKKTESKKQLIHYINYKNQSGYGKGRNDTKISYISVFGHGLTPRFTGGTENQLAFGYHLDPKLIKNVERDINFLQSDINSIKPEAFSANPATYFFTCNTGTADKDGLRFAQLWANKTRADTYAFKNARSNYAFMNCSMDEISVAFNLPGKEMDIAVSDIINGLREKGNEWGDSLNTEIITKVIGEESREVAQYISTFIVPFSVSEEWKQKRERGEDRERVDSNGHTYGYSDKGSLHYPMTNNILDDWDIILGTLGEERGFKKFTPE